jgi:hypothetical protein
MTSTTDLTTALALYRSTHAGATRLAGRIAPLVKALHESRIWLPREAAVRYLAHAIWGNTGFDACINYESPEAFAEELRPDLDNDWPERELREGVEHYVLRPFFSDTDHLSEAGLGSLRTCSLKEISALMAATPRAYAAGEAVTGLSDEELTTLIGMHKSATLAIVNAVRHLTTALSYPTSGLARVDGIRREVAVVLETGITERLAALAAAVALPGVEAPMAYFSSDWDKKCRLRDLALDSTLASFLRDC